MRQWELTVLVIFVFMRESHRHLRKLLQIERMKHTRNLYIYISTVVY